MTTVICVLKSGGIYGPEHVERLARQVRTHSDAKVVCLSDVAVPDDDLAAVLRLRHDWPGWWSKVHTWAMPGPAVYLDLDVTITGDLTPLLAAAEQHDFIACAGFWGADDPNPINSSVLAWRDRALQPLHEMFLVDPERYMREGKSRTCWGDQGILRRYYRGDTALWNDLLPGHVMSYKRDVLMGKPVGDCRVIVHHGSPKPWDAGVRLPRALMAAA